ncbi:hypothetical protein HAX54_028013, partial [Datura stramonium]|nr:hypothetical protein [Datura stramonium]
LIERNLVKEEQSKHKRRLQKCDAQALSCHLRQEESKIFEEKGKPTLTPAKCW